MGVFIHRSVTTLDECMALWGKLVAITVIALKQVIV